MLVAIIFIHYVASCFYCNEMVPISLDTNEIHNELGHVSYWWKIDV